MSFERNRLRPESLNGLGVGIGMKIIRWCAGVAILGSLILGTHLLVPVSAHSTPNALIELKPVDTNMHDFMEGMFQAPYRRLKESIAAEPKDNNGWKAIRSDVLILAEASNVAALRKPEKDEDKWNAFCLACKQDGEATFKSAKQKNYAETRKNYEAMLVNCNACHKVFAEGKHQLVP